MGRPALSAKQMGRFEFRIGLFQRRGLSPDDAEMLADRLNDRDMDGDDRRICLECEHMRRDGTCFAASIGKLFDSPGAGKLLPVLPRTLQRCASFSFVTP